MSEETKMILKMVDEGKISQTSGKNVKRIR